MVGWKDLWVEGSSWWEHPGLRAVMEAGVSAGQRGRHCSSSVFHSTELGRSEKTLGGGNSLFFGN